MIGGPRESSGISAAVEGERGVEEGVEEGEKAEEGEGETCPDPAVLPDSISNALKAAVVEREREQPRKT